MLRMSEREFSNYMKHLQEMDTLCKQNQIPNTIDTLTHDGSKRIKQPKHRNKIVYVYEDGIASTDKLVGHGDIKEKFDSIKEYQRACELRLLERAGKISNLETQKKLLIQQGFRNKDGVKIRDIVYKADFFYIDNDGNSIVEDVKAFDKKKQVFLTTEAFNLKWKLLQAKYPDCIFKLY